MTSYWRHVLCGSRLRCTFTIRELFPTAISNYVAASRVFLCSAAQGNQIVGFEKIKEKCVVLHNAVDVGVFAGGSSIREAIGLARNDIVIGTVARISHRKGIDLFLDTAERLLDSGKKFKFVIVGPQAVGEERYFQSIMERTRKGPLKESVVYLGSRADIPDILATFDVFFRPRAAKEPFGLVVIEAMASSGSLSSPVMSEESRKS